MDEAERDAREREDLGALGAHLERAVLDLQREVTRLQTEVEALKQYLAMVFPGFARRFPRIRERTLMEVDPDHHKRAAASP